MIFSYLACVYYLPLYIVYTIVCTDVLFISVVSFQIYSAFLCIIIEHVLYHNILNKYNLQNLYYSKTYSALTRPISVDIYTHRCVSIYNIFKIMCWFVHTATLSALWYNNITVTKRTCELIFLNSTFLCWIKY